MRVLLSRIKDKIFNNETGYNIYDKYLIKKNTNDLNFPYFISFPRTGSHWLRMLMELYFEKPSLSYVYFAKKPKSFTCYHRHDMELELPYRKQLIYLYRDPVDTIFSQLNYHKKDLTDTTFIKFQTLLYGLNFKKWVIDEDYAKNKVLLNYQRLKEQPFNEFELLCNFFKEPLDKQKLQRIIVQSTKEKIKSMTQHNNQVINISEGYEENRKRFKNQYSALIKENFYSIDEKIMPFFQK